MPRDSLAPKTRPGAFQGPLSENRGAEGEGEGWPTPEKRLYGASWGRFRKRNLKHAKERSSNGAALRVASAAGSGVSAVLETRQSRRLDSRAVFENGTDKASTGAARILTVAS